MEEEGEEMDFQVDDSPDDYFRLNV